MKRNWIVAGIILLVCVGGVLAVNFVVEQQDVLAGLQGVRVVVEDLGLDAKEAGLTREQLQIDVELKLRLAGIKVLSKEEFVAINIKSVAIFCVEVVARKIPDFPVYAFAISVSLNEKVILDRDPNTSTVAETWQNGCLGIASSNFVIEKVRKEVKDLVDKFINDYLAANPREQQAKD